MSNVSRQPHMRRVLCLISFSALTVVSAATAAPSLCVPSTEQTLFTCATYAGRVASVCASSNLSADAGYVQYRYGIPGKATELAFPSDQRSPVGNFGFSAYGGAKWISHNLQFKVGGYTYLISASHGVHDEPNAGIMVWRGAEYQCKYVSCSGDFEDNMTCPLPAVPA